LTILRKLVKPDPIKKMSLSDNFVSLIDALGVVQGLLFGIMLILLHSKKNKPTLFLGLFIILFALEPIPNILNDLQILSNHPQLELFPVGFHFLAYPFLYIYVQKISILNNQRLSYWTIFPGLFEFVAATVVFFLPYEVKLQIKGSSFAVLYFFSGLCYSLYIAYLILKQIYKHTQEVENQYTSMHSKTLSWSKWFVYTSIVFHILILLNFFINSHSWYVFITLINVILIYWVSFKGVTQENITALLWKNETKKEESLSHNNIKNLEATSSPLNLSPQLTTSLMSPEEAQETYLAIENYIKNSKCYTNEKLTIVDIAEATNIHPKRISYAINSIKSINFNNFINSFRVELAKKLLKSEQARNLSIEGIGIEAGFHSKTTFYSAFKKFEEMTPAQYKSS
jgi:AraC-like DNA-binding protein